VYIFTDPGLASCRCRPLSSNVRPHTRPSVAIQASNQPISGLALRDALPEDALCLSVLAMQVFLDTYATDGIRPELAREVLASYSQTVFSKAIAHRGSRIVIAELRGHVIGFAQVTLSATHELAPAGVQAELLRLYVQEPFTGAKVGTQLLARAEDIAASAGASVLWLTPWVHNHGALAFYSRRDYEDYGLTYFTFEGESHENRVLAKPLAVACVFQPIVDGISG
jgi:GNAT superfamily N-acetyltransferase